MSDTQKWEITWPWKHSRQINKVRNNKIIRTPNSFFSKIHTCTRRVKNIIYDHKNEIKRTQETTEA